MSFLKEKSLILLFGLLLTSVLAFGENEYPWKTRQTFSNKINYEGPLEEFPGINLQAGRVLPDFSGITNGWEKWDQYIPTIQHHHSMYFIINDEDKRYISTDIDTKRDERNPKKIKVKNTVSILETRQDSFPQELNLIRHKTVYKICDLGNDKVLITGTQKGCNIYLKETQKKVLSDWSKIKRKKIYLPFPSSIRSSWK